MVSLPSGLDPEVAALIAEETSFAGRGAVPGKSPGRTEHYPPSPNGAYHTKPVTT